MLRTSRTRGTLTERDLADSHSNFLKLEGIDLHYEFAKGKSGKYLVVLLHGFGASTFSYRKVINKLAEYGDVVSYDRPCFGLTERPKSWSGINPYAFPFQVKLLNAVIEHFGAGKKVILVGHSAGAAIAAEWSLAHPDRVAALVLEEPAILNAPPINKFMRSLLRSKPLDYLGPILVAGFKKTGLKILYASWFDKSGITDEVLENYTKPLKIIGWEAAFWEFSRNGVESEIDKNLVNITAPTLVFVAENDRIIPPASSRKVAELIPSAKLVEFTECGHIPHEEKPKEFLLALKNFIDQR